MVQARFVAEFGLDMICVVPEILRGNLPNFHIFVKDQIK